MRRANPLFTDAEIECTLLDANCIEVRYLKDGETIGIAVINPNDDYFDYSLTGDWAVLLDGGTAYTEPTGSTGESISVAPRSVTVVVPR